MFPEKPTLQPSALAEPPLAIAAAAGAAAASDGESLRLSIDDDLFLDRRVTDATQLIAAYTKRTRHERQAWKAPAGDGGGGDGGGGGGGGGDGRPRVPRLLVGWVPDVGVGNQMLALASYVSLLCAQVGAVRVSSADSAEVVTVVVVVVVVVVVAPTG
jgi:hypothetical protein